MGSWIVVEDEPDLYEMLMAMTEMIGIDGVAFTNGEDAVSWIEDVDSQRLKVDRPDLALVDIRLPGAVNGIELGARIRKSPALSGILVVLMTAYRLSPREERDLIRKAGADMLIHKPFPSVKKLSAMLQDHLARQGQPRRRMRY
jgi:DNA-binding response OmpR family regulator